jgi:hypothetical protein
LTSPRFIFKFLHSCFVLWTMPRILVPLAALNFNLSLDIYICLYLGVKNTCGSGSRQPYFFLPTLLFFQHDWPCNPIFSGWLRAATKMASVVTLIIEKTMKKYLKKNYFQPTEPNFFTRWNRNHAYFSFTP